MNTYSCHFTRISEMDQEKFDALQIGQEIDLLVVFMSRHYRKCVVIEKNHEGEEGVLLFSYESR